MKASLENYRQSPRKVRLVAATIKGKSVDDAVVHLSFVMKRAALPIRKLIESAAANAVAQGASRSALVVKKLVVDKGIVLRRSMPRARGTAKPIKKRSSRVVVELGNR
ncbi:MAG TPA: 50S ribosomal protein L22 [Candidatus Paceibacterota bacterium]|nr:50S ribosomal protein L22 [Candidatus Paceibacterota bacterium]